MSTFRNLRRPLALVLLGLASGMAQAEVEDDRVPPIAAAAAPAPVPLSARIRDFRQHRARPLDHVAEHAAAVLPYAALANAVYCDAVIKRQGDSGAAKPSDHGCIFDDDFQRHGWVPLREYPDDTLALRGNARGLKLAVFYRDLGPEQPVSVGVAFRGTDFTSWTDWHSNLRWFLPGRDQYDVVSEIAAPVLARSKEEIAARLGRPVAAWDIVATGHSLGGGLAQLFAYKSAEVRGAVVFDPSPVTAFHSCVSDDEVNCNVPIWRVYERGEVLAYVRAFTRLFYVLSENITELEFDLVGGNPIANHSMTRFYRQLAAEVERSPVAMAQQARLFEPRPDCTCMRVRRADKWASVAEACERLMTERDAAPAAARADLVAGLMP